MSLRQLAMGPDPSKTSVGRNEASTGPKETSNNPTHGPDEISNGPSETPNLSVQESFDDLKSKYETFLTLYGSVSTPSDFKNLVGVQARQKRTKELKFAEDYFQCASAYHLKRPNCPTDPSKEIERLEKELKPLKEEYDNVCTTYKLNSLAWSADMYGAGTQTALKYIDTLKTRDASNKAASKKAEAAFQPIAVKLAEYKRDLDDLESVFQECEEAASQDLTLSDKLSKLKQSKDEWYQATRSTCNAMAW